MNRAERRAKAAESAASEAGRVLQQQKVEKQEAVEPQAEKRPERPSDWKPQVRNEPRQKIIDELERKERERAGALEPTPEPEIPENPAPPTPEQMLEGSKTVEPAAEPVAEVPPVVEPEKPKTVKVKIYGEELEVPESEVEEAGGVKAYQIQKASERQLKEAKEAAAEQKRITALLADMLQKQVPQKPAEPQVSDDDFIKSKVDEIRFGSPEESAKALREVMARANKTVDTNTLIAQAQAKIEFDAATRKFIKDFPDINADPDLHPLVVNMLQQETNRRKQSGQGVDLEEIYSNIGSRIRTKFGRHTQASPSASKSEGQTSQPEREARKASITNLPTAAARASLPEADKPQTREQILQQARKARGLPTG